jgi:hypothetical protein
VSLLVRPSPVVALTTADGWRGSIPVFGVSLVPGRPAASRAHNPCTKLAGALPIGNLPMCTPIAEGSMASQNVDSLVTGAFDE